MRSTNRTTLLLGPTKGLSVLPPFPLIKQRRKLARSARSVTGLVCGRASFLLPPRLCVAENPILLFIPLNCLLSCHAGEATRVRSDHGSAASTVGCVRICGFTGAAAAAARPVDGSTRSCPAAGMPCHELEHRVGGGQLAASRAGARGATLPLGRPAGVDRRRAAGRRRGRGGRWVVLPRRIAIYSGADSLCRQLPPHPRVGEPPRSRPWPPRHCRCRADTAINYGGGCGPRRRRQLAAAVVDGRVGGRSGTPISDWLGCAPVRARAPSGCATAGGGARRQLVLHQAVSADDGGGRIGGHGSGR